ncbi:MAG: hypothetical protein ACODAQ_00040 [Phycisphaeraceae bacterium]
MSVRLLILGVLLSGLNWHGAFAPRTAFAQPSPDALAPRWDDEPDELNWQHFANCLDCFRDYKAWLENREADAALDRTAALPETFAMLWIEGEAFGDAAGGKGWQPQARRNASNGKVIALGAGHNHRFTRMIINVPAAGMYRLWTRYWDPTGGHASFRVRILPAEMADYEYSWQGSSTGRLLRHKFDFVPFKRDDGYAKRLVERKQSAPSRYVWASAPMMRLPKGRVCIELAGVTHRGPYQPRAVDVLMLTQDPLYVPSLSDAPSADHASRGSALVRAVERAPSSTTVDAWDVWTNRPGTQPLHEASEARTAQWRAWRRDLLERLADGMEDDAHFDKLAQWVYFNEDWNLIGTPAQVRRRIDQMSQSVTTAAHWFEWIEAERFEVTEPGWEPRASLDASDGAIMQASYTDGLAEAATTLTVPHDGEYTFWLRHARIKGFYNLFQFRFEPITPGDRDTDRPSHTLEFGDAEVGHGGYRQAWHKRTVKLGAGDYRLVLSKRRGRSPYAYRKVDCIVVTDDSTWEPEGITRPPMGTQRAAELFGSNNDTKLGIWQQSKTWEGFTATNGPGREDRVLSQAVTQKMARGEVRSMLLHVRNLTDEPITFQPRITGALGDHVRWRVVAYQLSKGYGWQPMPLLARRTVTAQPHRSVALWLTLDARDLNAGTHEGTLTIGSHTLPLRLHAQDLGYAKTPKPLVGGWAAPYSTPHAWRMFTDVGFNLIYQKALPADQMEALGIRRFVLKLGVPDDEARVRRVIDAVTDVGLDRSEWTWELFDEPHDKSVDRWVDGAKNLQAWAPDVAVWCNPGEHQNVSTETVSAMAPYIDVFCPYINHFQPEKEHEHTKLVRSIGDVQLFYTTPCFDEKAPNAPHAMLSLGERAQALDRDGWSFFSVLNYYDYATGPWDDINAPFPAQAVSIYPGAHDRAISTRNLEAVREAIRRWRRAQLNER